MEGMEAERDRLMVEGREGFRKGGMDVGSEGDEGMWVGREGGVNGGM